MAMDRRHFLQAGAAMAAVGCANIGHQSKPHVIVVGGGYGGCTAAKYVRIRSEGAIDVTLIEPNAKFVSCPLSNLVLGGSLKISDLTIAYDQLERRHGVRLVHDSVSSIDPDKRSIKLLSGEVLAYDRLILSPGIELLWSAYPGMQAEGAQDKILHAWKAGPQTVALRLQLEAMPDGGVYVLTIPAAPYRGPVAPYERACQIAHYFRRHKPKSKVLLLDANADVVSESALFKQAWRERYAGIIEYRPGFNTADVDVGANAVISGSGDRVKADVLNVVPPQRAAAIAVQTELANAGKRWCEVDFLTFESTQAKYVHVLGDAIQAAPLMRKSGHMANQHAKVCAAAVVDLLQARAPSQQPQWTADSTGRRNTFLKSLSWGIVV
jgi:NADPH-dependent 2,4-dienoyl-CoA reductase/sulfur reductase-like enzyme